MVTGASTWMAGWYPHIVGPMSFWLARSPTDGRSITSASFDTVSDLSTWKPSRTPRICGAVIARRDVRLEQRIARRDIPTAGIICMLALLVAGNADSAIGTECVSIVLAYPPV